MGVEIYKDPTFAGMFRPVPGGLTIKLDEEATNNIILNHRGPKSKLPTLYIMLTLEGNLHPNWSHEPTWERVIRRATEAPMVVYNTRTKKASRPVWFCDPSQRSLENLTWEKVTLIPVDRCLDKSGLPASAKLFL